MAFSKAFLSPCKPLFILYALLFVSKLPLSVSTLEPSSPPSQTETEPSDDLCTQLTSMEIWQLEPLKAAQPPPNGSEKARVQVCINFDGVYMNDLFRLVVGARGRAGDRGLCLIEPLSLWLKNCWRARASGFIPHDRHSQAPNASLYVNADSSNIRTRGSKTSLTRYVDFLFLVETPENSDVNRTDNIIHAVKDLVKAVSTGVFNIDARFAFVLYPLDSDQCLMATDFDPNVTDVIEYLLKSEASSDTTIPASGSEMNTRFSRYVSVEKALSQVERVLQLVKGEEVNLWPQHEGVPVTLSRRQDSDLHILTFMDMTASSTSSQSRDNNNHDSGISLGSVKDNIDKHITSILDELQLHGDQSTSFHYFFSPSNLPAKSYLGDPIHSVRYSDCSHFNKALTLKALLSSDKKDLANSLQAHMLSKGLEMQVHLWNDLQRRNCFLGVSPALSTPSGLQYKFNNVCQDTDSGDEMKEGYFCSPLHGWVKKDEERKDDLFEGKAPLSDQFMASHADLLKPQPASDENNNNNVSLPLVQLTIDQSLGIDGQNRFKPVIEGRPRILQWSPDKSFIKNVLSKRKPTVLKNTIVHKWPALNKWNLSYLETRIGVDMLPSVKCTNTFLTFDPDKGTPLKLNISLPFTPVNMSTESFFKCIQRDPSEPTCSDGYKGHYYFGSVPDTLKEDVMPDKFLYHTEKDYKANKQFMWISSAGMITHTHFDQDYNFFVQLVGKKHFTLWSPHQHELMYVYPRVHPMWHKSRVSYRAVDLERFPAFAQARAKQVELGPGDMLYVPPYTWHYVETLTTSVSLSTWSHDYDLYDHMNAIYRHDHKFDLLEDPRGQMFVLRLYLDMMVHSLYGFNQTTQFFTRLVNNRYSDLEHLFPASQDDPDICSAAVSGKIPTCHHVHGYAKLDMTVIGSHFEELESEVRDILFQDYVEEITAQVVGVKKMLAFFRYCFLGQDYYVTDIDDSEHLLWEHKNCTSVE